MNMTFSYRVTFKTGAVAERNVCPCWSSPLMRSQNCSILLVCPQETGICQVASWNHLSRDQDILYYTPSTVSLN